MNISCAVCCLILAIGFVAANPIAKRAVEEELSPLNEMDDDDAAADEGRGDREKRKIGIVKLGVTNGILNFVFGKLDSFLDAKTRALSVLDESNKAKNAAFGIDNTQSATSQFISNFIAQKIQAGTASIGPIINSATTLISGAKSGLQGAFAAKLAPLSSLSGGLSGGAGGSNGILSGGSGGGSGGITGALGGILASKLGSLSSLSGTSNLSGGGGGFGGGIGGGSSAESTSSSEASSSAGAGAGIDAGASIGTGAGAGVNLGAFANLGGALGGGPY